MAAEMLAGWQCFLQSSSVYHDEAKLNLAFCYLKQVEGYSHDWL
jgi:hypothetical protein